MRGPLLQSHVTIQYRGHVINKKRYISLFIRPMDHKLSGVVLRMREPHPQSHVTHQSRLHVFTPMVPKTW